MVFDINNSIYNYEPKMKELIKREIYAISEDLILKTDGAILIKKLKETYKIDNIKLEINELKRCEDKGINFKEDYEIRHGSFKYDELIFKIPYLGDKELFDYCPNSYTMPMDFIKIRDKDILFKIIYQNNNIDYVKSEIKKYCDYLTNMIESLNKDIGIINNNLNNFIEIEVLK